jgi:hypothetical protein
MSKIRQAYRKAGQGVEKSVLSDRKKSARKLHHPIVTQDRAARIFPQIFGKVLYGLITYILNQSHETIIMQRTVHIHELECRFQYTVLLQDETRVFIQGVTHGRNAQPLVLLNIINKSFDSYADAINRRIHTRPANSIFKRFIALG